MKKEYLKRKSRRVTAMALALLMSVSIFPQALPKAWAAAPDAEAAEEEPLETIETAAEETVKEAPAEKAAENELTAEELEALHDGNYDRFMGSATKIPAAAELDVENFDARKLLVADNAYAKLTDVQKALEDVAAAYANMEAVRALLEGTPEPEAPVMALSAGGTFYTKQDGTGASKTSGRNLLKFTVTSEAPATVSIAKAGSSYKPSGEFIIPSSVEYDGVTYSVTSFGDAAFNDCSGLTSVTIPSSFTSIRAQAFEGCSGLTSVIIPSSVTSIGEMAFGFCSSLTSVTIPSSVTSIGEMAFDYCSGLSSVIIEGSPESIAFDAFNGVGNIYVPVTLVIRSDISDAPTGTNPVGWKYGHFNVDFMRPVKIDSNIKNGKVTASPATVQDSATSRTVTLTVTPDSGYELDELYYIAKSAPTDEISIVSSSFSMPKDDVTVSATFKAKPLAKGDSFFTAQDGSDPSLSAGVLMFTVTNAANKTVSIARGTSDPSGTLSIPKTVTYNGIEYTVTSIKNEGFRICDSITSVTIPDSITNIASNAFDSCHWVTSVTIPNSVTNIGSYAFYNCNRLKTVTIPNSVTNIGDYAFSKCEHLKTVTIPDSVTHIGGDAFRECRRLETVTISNSVTKIPGNTFAFCESLTTVIIGKSVTDVGSNAFRGVGESRAATLILAPESKLDLTPDEDGMITLGNGRFILSYIIAIDSTIQNGTVTTDKTIAKKDETVTVTVTPATGYELEKLTYKAGTSDPVEIKLKDGKYTFTMPDDNVTVSATFKQPHTHEWTYTASDNVIKAYCTKDDCTEYKGEENALTLTLTAADADYVPNTAYAGASVDNKITPVITDKTASAIKYTGVSPTVYAESETAPTNAGTYTASVTLGTKTATIRFTINKADQTVTTGNDVIMIIGDTDKSVTASVTTGDGTISYSISPTTGLAIASDGTLTATKAGTYTVTAKVSATTNYNEATCDDTITVTVGKKTQTINVTGNMITVTYGTPVALGASTDGDGTLSYDNATPETVTVDGDGNVAFVAEDTSGRRFVKVKAAETDTYKAAEVNVYVKTLKAPLIVAFDDSNPTTIYAGETAAQAAARFKGKFEGLVDSDTIELVGTPVTYIVDADDNQRLPDDIVISADGSIEYKIAMKLILDGSKKDCYAPDTTLIISDTLTAAKREQTIAADNLTLKNGETGISVSGTVSEKAIENITALTGKFGALSYEVTKGADYITIDASTGAITAKADGEAEVTITAAANDYYEAATKTITVTVTAKDIQTITASAPTTIFVGDNTQKVTATTDGNGALNYTATPADVVSVAADGTITALKAGEATITVTAAETDDYAADDENITVTVSKRTQEVKASDLTIADTDSGVTIDAIVSEVAVSGVPALLGKTAKPLFTSSDDSIATVNEDGVITVNKPGKVTISMTLPGNDFYNEVTVPTEVTLTIDELAVIEGTGGKYKVGSKEGLTFRSNGVYDNFLGVQVDGKDVDASNYTAWSGSTYVKFTTKYLDSLATGKHTLTYVFKNGTCDAYFYIERPSGGNGDSPDTGDKSNIILWTSLLVLSTIGLAAVVIDRKKRGYSIMK